VNLVLGTLDRRRRSDILDVPAVTDPVGPLLKERLVVGIKRTELLTEQVEFVLNQDRGWVYWINVFYIFVAAVP